MPSPGDQSDASGSLRPPGTGSTAAEAPAAAPVQPPPTFGQALRFWLLLGFISFGGPTGQIAIMHAELVEKRRWVSERRFLHALNYCVLLPGPEAQQLAIYLGWLLHSTVGGLVAGILFVLPAAILLWLLSVAYVLYGETTIAEGLLWGMKAAVCAIVAHAVWRIGSRVLKRWWMWIIAAASFLSAIANVPFPIVIVVAGLVGLVSARHSPPHAAHAVSDSDADPLPLRVIAVPSWRRNALVIAIGLILWWTPVAASGLLLGREHALTHEGVFFSKAAMVTFGGAYAVLPYVAQQAVEHYHWLSATEMADGLALAETTPGPLIIVLQFVGFLGGWNHSGPLQPMLAATLGAAMTTWVTFVPCFLWIFLGAPYVERLKRVSALNGALAGITAAVVGMILHLALWFAGAVFWPHGTSASLLRDADWGAIALAAVALVLLARWKVTVVTIIIGSAIAGLARSWLVQ